MKREEFAKRLQEETSPEKMKEWEVKCKREIIEHFTIKTKRPKEEVINAIKNTKHHWQRLYQVVQDKNCGNEYGFFDCKCEGDMSACPHSHAYLDIEWEENKKTGKINYFKIGARPCSKYMGTIKEKQNEQKEIQDRLSQLY